MSQANTWAQRPTAKKPTAGDAADLDKFVNGSKGTITKRLNVEIPAELRTRVKTKCASEGREIRDVVTELLQAWVNK